MKQRILNILIAFDQLVFVLITLGWGFPDETLSSAAFRAERDGKLWGKLLRPAIDTVFRLIEKEHCYRSYVAEKWRLQQPEEFRS